MNPLIWVAIFYFSVGFCLCVFAAGEMLCDVLNVNEFPIDKEFKWWHIPKTFAFLFFCGPAYCVYIVCKHFLHEKNKNEPV